MFYYASYSDRNAPPTVDKGAPDRRCTDRAGRTFFGRPLIMASQQEADASEPPEAQISPDPAFKDALSGDPNLVPRRDKSLSALSHELIEQYGQDGTVIDLDDVQVHVALQPMRQPAILQKLLRVAPPFALPRQSHLPGRGAVAHQCTQTHGA